MPSRSRTRRSAPAVQKTTFLRFDGAAAWVKLSEEQRCNIGALALELIVGDRVASVTGNDAEHAVVNRAAQASVDMLLGTLDETVIQALDDAIEIAGYPIPVTVGRICEGCGCTDLDPCEGGCAWHSPGLCTSCACMVKQ